MKALINTPRAVRGWFAEGIFRRTFKNACMLLSGRAANGVLSLATLSIAAHSLGAEQFGILVLVQVYVLVISGLATFQSWQAVIRYGAICLEQNDLAGFQSLLKFTTLLDVGGVILGTVVGYICAPLIGPHLEWSPEVISYARPYSLLVLFTMTATPTGLLRLYDRFKLLSGQVVITPVLRLVGVAITVVLNAPFWGYLLAWFVGGVVGGAALVYLGWREAMRRGHTKGMTWSLRGLTHQHPGIWRFSLVSNLHSSLVLVSGQMATFLVGLVATPLAAGLFKVGRDVSTVLTKPAEMLAQSVYPEFARLGSTGCWHDFRALILRGAAVAGGCGLAVVLIAALIGKPFLTIAFGPEFAGAYGALVMLVAAACLNVCGFSIDPALYAMGRPGITLKANMVVILFVFIPLLLVLTPRYGATGAGAAALVASFITLAATVTFTAVQLRLRAAPPPAMEPPRASADAA